MYNKKTPPVMKKKKYFFLLFFPLLFGALGGVVMFLWNTILPQVAQVNALTYWQALGLLLLCRILFGSFRFGGRRSRPPFGRPSPYIREKWMNMSEEERTKFKEEWRKRCAKP
jgi:hypothetical protein